jgi:hypothetical protein
MTIAIFRLFTTILLLPLNRDGCAKKKAVAGKDIQTSTTIAEKDCAAHNSIESDNKVHKEPQRLLFQHELYRRQHPHASIRHRLQL